MPEVVNGYKWELYNIAEDYSQNNDLAAKNPDKLKELQELSWSRLRNTTCSRWTIRSSARLLKPRPSCRRPAERLHLLRVRTPASPSAMRPNILNKSYTITAEMDVPQGGAEGMIVTLGGRFGGYGLYLLKGKPVFTYNLLDLERFRWEGGVGDADCSRPASTRSCSTSNTTGPASARAAPAC